MRRTAPRLLCIFYIAVTGVLADVNSGLKAFDAHDYGYAISQFLPAADQGNAQAQNALGFLYEHGLGISKNLELAARWYRKSADQGYGPGEYNYGLMCWKGQGVAQSEEQAIEWLRKASHHGIALAAFDLGAIYYKGGQGDSTEALRWWQLAAGKNVAAAAYNLAYLYAEGPNVPQDYAEAAKWYGEAARLNYPLAQYALGLLYLHGKGVAADPVHARMWLELAARGGVKEAREEIDSSKSAWTPEQVADALRAVTEWAPSAPETRERFVTFTDPAPAPMRKGRVVADTGPADYWPKGTATGFFANSEGLVVASADSVRGCKNIVLKTATAEQHAALLREDAESGLALLETNGDTVGAAGLALAEARPGDEPLVQIGYQLHGSDARAQAVPTALEWRQDRPNLRTEHAPDPPLAGGPVLNAKGVVIAFQTPGSHLVLAEALSRFIQGSHASSSGIAITATDLSGVADAAKKNLVLVQCKQ